MKNEEIKDVRNVKEIPTSTSVLYTSSVPFITILCRSEARTKKLFYFTLFIVSTCSCLFHIFQFVNLYLQYPVLNIMSTENDLNAEFPAVTVCNLNRAKSYYQERIKSGLEMEFVASGFSGKPLNRRIIFTELKSYSFTGKDTEDNVTQNYRNEARHFYNNFTKIQEISRIAYGYSLYEIITNCHFDSQPCYQNNFTFSHHLQYGNCYTFNKRKEMGGQLISHRLGPTSGLELTLEFGTNTYLDLTPSVGIRVVIHDAEEDPDPMENGFNISPDFKTNVALLRSSIRRLPHPYRDRCFEYGISSSFPSQLECVRSCMQEVYLSRCSCVEPFMNAGKNKIRCDLRNVTQMSCLDLALEDLKKNGLPCECPIACVTNSYSYEISSSQLTTHDTFSPTFIYLSAYTQHTYNFSDNDEYGFSSNNRSYGPFLGIPYPNNYFPNYSSPNDSFPSYSFPSYSFPGYSFPNYSFPSYSFPNYSFPSYTYPEYFLVENDTEGNFTYVYDYGYDFNSSQYIPNFNHPKRRTAKLKVYFKNFNKAVYYQAPMVTISEIVSHVGGLLSLWLGFSFLAFFELFEVIFTMISRYIRKKI